MISIRMWCVRCCLRCEWVKCLFLQRQANVVRTDPRLRMEFLSENMIIILLFFFPEKWFDEMQNDDMYFVHKDSQFIHSKWKKKQLNIPSSMSDWLMQVTIMFDGIQCVSVIGNNSEMAALYYSQTAQLVIIQYYFSEAVCFS